MFKYWWVAELVGVVYLAFKAGGLGADDAKKALYGVAAWIVLGMVWVAVNPKMRSTKLLDNSLPKREPVLTNA